MAVCGKVPYYAVSDEDKFFSHEGVVARTILFDSTVKDLLAKYPDAVCINIGCIHRDRMAKHTNAKFGWGTETGNELLAPVPKLELVKESSFWDEIKKYKLAGKIGSVIAKKINNRLAVYKWGR